MRQENCLTGLPVLGLLKKYENLLEISPNHSNRRFVFEPIFQFVLSHMMPGLSRLNVTIVCSPLYYIDF